MPVWVENAGAYQRERGALLKLLESGSNLEKILCICPANIWSHVGLNYTEAISTKCNLQERPGPTKPCLFPEKWQMCSHHPLFIGNSACDMMFERNHLLLIERSKKKKKNHEDIARGLTGCWNPYFAYREVQGHSSAYPARKKLCILEGWCWWS